MTTKRERDAELTRQREQADELSLDKQTIKDLEADESQREQVKGGIPQVCTFERTGC